MALLANHDSSCSTAGEPEWRFHRSVLPSGSLPRAGHAASDVDLLIQRCAIEPDFQVREMLTWALLRLPHAIVAPRLATELRSVEPQARSQALHTLSKLKDSATWPAVAALLDDDDQAVARTAWYSAVAIVPEDQRGWLAEKLARLLGRGSKEEQLSLSRALAALGGEVVRPILSHAGQARSENIRLHVAATQQLIDEPDAAFSLSLGRARREVALGRTRSTKG